MSVNEDMKKAKEDSLEEIMRLSMFGLGMVSFEMDSIVTHDQAVLNKQVEK